jgi:molecular chaperone DnaK (HSP70)
MPAMWALDLGTTNTLLARWDEAGASPRVVELPELARASAPRTNDRASTADRGIPSALEVLAEPGPWARWTRNGLLARWVPGTLAHIGRAALDRNAVRPSPGFVPSFKRALMEGGLAVVARTPSGDVTAREALYLYLRALLAAAKRVSGERPASLVVTTPSHCFEAYRAEVAAALRRLGVRRVRFLDEPVAAALGYGVGLTRARRVLVVDCGGGTMHVAAVALTAATAQAGTADVLAKAGRRLGGDDVDLWLAEAYCDRAGFELFRTEAAALDTDERAWRRLLLAEARRVKEAVYFEAAVPFEVTPPETLRRTAARARGEQPEAPVTRPDLEALLEKRGYLAALAGCLDEVTGPTPRVPPETLDEVLVVGGSTLLPGVFALLEGRFGRDRVRAWQPFEAVARGGAVFAGNRVAPADFIVHEYALLTHDRETGAPAYTPIVPRGTRFPTRPDLWSRALVPTCSLGAPERVFKLVVCEVGAGTSESGLAWDGAGRLAAPGGPVVVELNRADPTLGVLDPPHSPRDERPRLRVDFGVNAERWLCATVVDLLTHRTLMKGEPVVRLL